ncbi:MAG: dihydroorotate dehydrogenase-like protein [Phycisphaerales bacterium]|nr:MAG: dihydroorotate dehydrogenase-like protein [Phycisphaerales bacterium]
MDLSTNYLGFHLKTPLVAAASPMSRDAGAVRAMEDAGIAAVVMYSLFEEQIAQEASAHDHFVEFGAESFAESLTYAPPIEDFPRGPVEYVEHVRRLKESVDIPIIASLNGATPGGWTRYAAELEQAGADAIELNVYLLATDPETTAQQIEQRHLEILAAVKECVRVPVAMKLGAQFTALANFARQLDRHGVDGLVLFNRFYQPDVDLDNLEVTPQLDFSARHELRLPLRWIAVLDPIVEASLAATTGVYDYQDVLKLMMVGADAAMMCAALLTGGPQVATRVLNNMREWMEEHEYESVKQMQGSMNLATCPDPGAFERANYMKALASYV